MVHARALKLARVRARADHGPASLPLSARLQMSHRRPITALTSARLLAAIALAGVLFGLSSPATGLARSRGRATTAQSGISNLRLIDYFPSAAGWGSMWTNWNPTRMEADFQKIAGLHANGVRIIVNLPSFGFPKPNATMVNRLAATVRLAAAQGLSSELTLFDGWSSYGDVEESKTWVKEVLAPLHGSTQVAYIDLHNELPANTARPALSWARAMVPYVQSIDGGIPVTVSTSISSGTAPLKALIHGLAASPPNLYDVHYYGNAADAYPVLREAKTLAAGVPLIVGETGFATSPSYGGAQGLEPDESSLEAFQDYYLRMVENATRALGLPLAAPWILYDMPGQGNTEWGHHIGILHANGTPKAAANALSEIFAGDPVSPVLNNGFEQSTGSPAEPTIWRAWLPQDASFAIDKTVAHAGSASARIEHAGGSHRTGCPAFFAAPIAAITPGVRYTAGAWARGAAASGLSRLVLTWTNSAGRYIASSDSPPLPAGTTSWQALSVTAKPPPGAAAVEIDLQVCENQGTTWFDDVSFSPNS
jgi:hypothetical protein